MSTCYDSFPTPEKITYLQQRLASDADGLRDALAKVRREHPERFGAGGARPPAA